MRRFAYSVTSLLLSCFVLVQIPSAVAAGPQQQTPRPLDSPDRQPVPFKSPPGDLKLEKERRKGYLEPHSLPKSEVHDSEKNLAPAQKKLLDPAPEDLARFKEILRQPDTGIIRLIPFTYEFPAMTVAAGPNSRNAVPIIGGGAFYSFMKNTHVQSRWSDIQLRDNHLLSGFSGGALGLMVQIGDTPIESVTAKSPGVDFLVNMVPPTTYQEATDQSKRNSEGFIVNSLTYRSFLSVAVDVTYALRSITYERSDMVIAFRIIRRDEDGSVTLLWKNLQKLQGPRLKD